MAERKLALSLLNGRLGKGLFGGSSGGRSSVGGGGGGATGGSHELTGGNGPTSSVSSPGVLGASASGTSEGTLS